MNCGVLTKKGNPCKNGKNCHLHKTCNGETCSICLNPVKKTRGTKKLWCGHTFHTSCIEGWKESGTNTCPLCRKKFDVSKYNVSIKIENNRTEEIETLELSPSTIFTILERIGQEEEFLNSSTTEINFEIDDIDELNILLNDLGVDTVVE